MDDLSLIEQTLMDALAEAEPNIQFRNTLKQKLLDRSSVRRKQVLYQWLAYALVGMVSGVAVYGMVTLIRKNDEKLLCCRLGGSSECSS